MPMRSVQSPNLVPLTSLLSLPVAGCSTASHAQPYTRGVAPVPADGGQDEDARFDPRDSAGLFVGVRFFESLDRQPNGVPEVFYAVDDAIDLAHMFSVVLKLIAPTKVTLALSGDPQKPQSAERLRQLLDSGARRTDARFINLVSLISRASREADKRGLLVMSFATHGYSSGGADGLLAQDSSLSTLDLTGIPVRVILDSASSSGVLRRLVLLDACRERVATGARGLSHDVSEVSSTFFQAIGKARGLAVMSGATAGGFSYDDSEVKNGVFTSRVIAGLEGQAQGDARGFITPATLAMFVDDQVRAWVRANRPEHTDISRGIQFICDDVRSGEMPLAPTPAAGRAGIRTRADKLVAELMVFPTTTPHTTRSSDRELKSWSPGRRSQLRQTRGPVSFFAERNEHQWAIIIGTNPIGAVGPSAEDAPRTELLDAIDVLDWFNDPRLVGPIPRHQLFYLWNKGATLERVKEALEAVRRGIASDHSLLLYFSGHATNFSEKGEILLYDALGGNWDNSNLGESKEGMIEAPWLIDWINQLPAEKVICILDSGGLAFHQASHALAVGRYVISSVNSRVTNRNGVLTWLVREMVKERGKQTTVDFVRDVLEESDQLLYEKHHFRLYAYVSGGGED